MSAQVVVDARAERAIRYRVVAPGLVRATWTDRNGRTHRRVLSDAQFESLLRDLLGIGYEPVADAA